MRDSGLDFSSEDPFRAGVILGSGIGGLNEIEAQHSRLMQKGPDKVSAFTIPKLMVNAASGHVSIQYGLRGPNTAVATACASAANAIGDAFSTIQHDEADIMVTGGTEAAITPMGIAGFSNMRALSERNDDPQRASRPFDRDRDGFVLGEGAGPAGDRRTRACPRAGRASTPSCSATGRVPTAATSPSPTKTAPAPPRPCSGHWPTRDLRPRQIVYINAHGTSTPLGDRGGDEGRQEDLRRARQEVSISSTKSQSGICWGPAAAWS